MTGNAAEMQKPTDRSVPVILSARLGDVKVIGGPNNLRNNATKNHGVGFQAVVSQFAQQRELLALHFGMIVPNVPVKFPLGPAVKNN